MTMFKCSTITKRRVTIADALALASTPLPPEHRDSPFCRCPACLPAACRGCYNPSECRLNAGRLFLQLPPFWNPLLPGPDESAPGEPLVPPTQPRADTIYFNPSMTTTSITDAFRICLRNPEPPRATQPSRPPLSTCSPPSISVYTDGSSQISPQRGHAAGSGVWYGSNDPRNKSIRLPPLLPQTNNAAELAAILVAVQDSPLTHRVQVLSDSKYSLDVLSKNLEKAENAGFLHVANAPLLRSLITHLRSRPTFTTLTKVKAHAGIEGNEGADRLASVAANLAQPHDLDITPKAGLIANGIKLSTATQALLYRAILAQMDTQPRRATALNLALALEANGTRLGVVPTVAQVWLSLSNKAMSRPARAFLWKCLHGAHRVGSYWSHIPELDQRAKCHICDTEETMSHILTECPASGQHHVWCLVKEILRKKKIAFPTPSLGLIMGCAIKAAPLPHQNAATTRDASLNAGSQRLYAMVVSESAHLIWKLRCHWRIQNEGNPDSILPSSAVRRKWLHAINRRLKFDVLHTNKSCYEKKALRRQLVLQTWRNTLHDEENLPDDWTTIPGVLVGIGREQRPPGRNR